MLSAGDRSKQLEYALFSTLRDQVGRPRPTGCARPPTRSACST